MRELFFKCIGAILVLYTGAAMGWLLLFRKNEKTFQKE